MAPFTKRTVTIQPQARDCMQKLGISEAEVLTTINEWESGDVEATDPIAAHTLAAYPETAAEIPAFYDSERDFPERNQTISVKYSTSCKQRRGTTIVIATVHWVSVQPSPETLFFEDPQPGIDWLGPRLKRTIH